MDYYNEHDPFAAAWLRELIAAGEIPAGHVDERDIQDVQPSDLMGYRHCHFFAGIGGWAYALRLADWPDDQPIWTGSAPCQPFSAAGQGAGFADERHLWPAFFWLISQCRPRYVCGEQVASGDALRWWDLVATDLEGAGYACTAVDLPAASVGAPHKRSRLFWLADATTERHDWRRAGQAGDEPGAIERPERLRAAGVPVADAKHTGHHRPRGAASEPYRDQQGQWLPDGDCREGAVADAVSAGRAEGWPITGRGSVAISGASVLMADISHDGRRGRGWPERDRPEGRLTDPCGHQPDGCGDGGSELDNAIGSRLEGFGGHGADGDESRRNRTDAARPVATASGADGMGGLGDAASDGKRESWQPVQGDRQTREAGGSSAWDDLVWLPCTDGKARPTQPGLQPLAYGVSNRVGTLRGAGNAIIAQAAAEVLKAWQAVMR